MRDADPVVARLRTAGCVFAEDEAALLRAAGGGPRDLEERLCRREGGEPLEYILGWAEFCGLRIAVGDGVFVPRRRTRVLAEQAVALVASAGATVVTGAAAPVETPARPVVLDLCCGAGAIAAVLVAAHPEAEVHAADLDPIAVAWARRNLPGRPVYLSDLFAAIPDQLRGRIDVLAVNAPYVPTDAIELMPSEARDHERRLALDGGPDGLDLHRRVIAAAPRWLAAGGHLLLESSEDQAPVTASLMAAAGLAPRIVHDDEVDGTAVIGAAGSPLGSPAGPPWVPRWSPLGPPLVPRGVPAESPPHPQRRRS